MTSCGSEAILLEGKKVGAGIRQDLERKVRALKERAKVSLRLASVKVGEDASSEWYFRAQEKAAVSLGIEFEAVCFSGEATEEEVAGAVSKLSAERPDVHGVIVTLPMPAHIDTAQVLSRLSFRKDVEGILPESLGLIVLRRERLVPATALAAMMMIESTGMDVRGKVAVLAGQSAIVGRPLTLMLGTRRATVVVCNTGTTEAQLASFVRQADIVVGCCGKPSLISGDWIKDGAVVIDVGTTEVEGKLKGDVDFESARKRAKYITPVPGGVGPLTTLMLMKNLVSAYEWQKENQGRRSEKG